MRIMILLGPALHFPARLVLLCLTGLMAACGTTPTPPSPATQASEPADGLTLRMTALPPPAPASAAGSDDRMALSDYIHRLRTKLRGNIVVPRGVRGNPEAVFMVSQKTNGEITRVQLKHSSGSAVLDRALEQAIRRSSPLPLPGTPGLFAPELELKLRPLQQ